MPNLFDLQLQGVGLLELNKIDEICPGLQILDISRNKLFKMEAIEILHKLPHIAEVSYLGNPLCIHKHLDEMIKDVVPHIEVINETQIKEAGLKYKEEKEAIMRRI